MPPETATLTLAIVLTAAGATASATFITGLIALLKNVPALGTFIDDGREPGFVLLASAVLVGLAFASAGVVTVATAFAAFVAWYGIAELAMAIHKRGSALTGQG